MSHFQPVLVTALTADTVTLQFPDGSAVTWPRDAHTADVAVGDELIVTLTRSRDVLNDVLRIDDN